MKNIMMHFCVMKEELKISTEKKLEDKMLLAKASKLF